jgi:opacity protein-like surface antigen
MKPNSRAISTLAGAACAAIFLIPSPAPGAEADFFQKFVVDGPMNWSGPYVGFNNGGSFNNFHIGHHMTDVDVTDQFYDLNIALGNQADTFATFDTPGHHKNDTQTIGGGQTGYRLQFGHIVIGAEGSFIGNGSTQDARFNDFQTNELFVDGGAGQPAQQIGGITAETVFQSMQKFETTWNGFVGGNVGFAWNRFLFYGEGGAAFTDVHFESTDKGDTSFFENCVEGCGDLPTVPTSGTRLRRATQLLQPEGFFIGEIINKKTHTQGDILTGWYGGGGFDYALTKFVSVGMEYKHVDWGGVTEHQIVGSNGGPVLTGNGHLNLDADQVMFKVNILVGALGH